MQNPTFIIVFGAAVTTSGEPSGAMKRRIKSALLTSKKIADVRFIVSGGVGSGKPISEAEAMKILLIKSGITKDKIIIENKALDTLSSVLYCQEIIKSWNNYKAVFVCSDTYHIPRCRWLFNLFKIQTKPAKTISGLQANGFFKWVYYYIRECAAIPYDTLLVFLYKLGFKTIK